MTNSSSLILTLALVLPFTSWAQGEVQFNRSQSTVQIDRVFVLAGESNPCQGVEIDAQAVAEYAEVRLLSQYEILERKHLEMILKEQSLGMSGLVFEDQAVEAGCLQGSEGVVFCEVGCLAGQSMIKLKLVDCKESVQQWSAVGIDATIKSIFDRIEGKRALNQSPSESRAITKSPTFNCGQDWTFDNYRYATVQIGDQCWFAENLRSTRYADGTTIPDVPDDGRWSVLETGASCDYQNKAANVTKYGRLYNWYAVDDARGLCPSGWHVPTDGDWTDLENYITSQGIYGTEGTALKSASGWSSGGNGTDDFGFSALSGGIRSKSSGSFMNAGKQAYSWSSSSYRDGTAWYRALTFWGPDVHRSVFNPRYGLSVRCLRDAE
ncbi:fibrobacter succinogenes major paralogous domain-containing protein [Flavobacteriales bacterium]|nr:fibrobacter succinogenes major paralogous domain-containing protein [Flavobacteriales bacterium]